ncbi:hypothetical protein NC653_038188 [Populus alba x Populus x berolinensis]|uniref:Uncharacterized protein n=1 Tax=Populus alba x Populus x berolinensis TaxID=444605 RepID=A0AAD6LG27_9ROSI|nr:hypothetical protein NC653_038188 [Populus alba x Populus x berolinensis]
MQFSPAQDIIRRTMGRTILLAFQLRFWINGDAMVVKNAMAARDIAIFSNTLDTSGNLLLINCETRREQKNAMIMLGHSRVNCLTTIILICCGLMAGEGVSCGGGGDCSSISMQRVVPAILLTGIQGLWKEKEVVYVTVVVLEVVVASFLGYVIKMQRLVFWVLRSLGNGKRGLWIWPRSL